MEYFFIFFDFGLRETRQNFEKFLRGSTQILKNVGGFAVAAKQWKPWRSVAAIGRSHFTAGAKLIRGARKNHQFFQNLRRNPPKQNF